MRIACPSCTTEYEVPAYRMTPRKKLRCARCGGEWTAVREAEDLSINLIPTAAPVEPGAPSQTESPKPLPTVTAMDRLAASPPPARSRAGLIAAWVLTFVVLTGAVAAVITYRQAIVTLWPPSGRILGPIDHMRTSPERIAGKATE